VDLIAEPTPEEARFFNEVAPEHLQAKAEAADVRVLGGMQ
jgi:hypothetical protein